MVGSYKMSNLLIERREGAIVYLGFNRPDKRNAYNIELIAELNSKLRQLSRDKEIGVLILHGDAKAFCSGGDLKEVRTLAEIGAEALRDQWFQPLMEMTRRLVTFPVPTIAAIRGAALAGGLEIALCCDFLVATDDAKIGDQHINHGLIPGGGATETIVNRIGPQRAKDLILTGRRISGTEAARIGLALWSVPEETFDEALNAFAVQLSDKRREASRLVKMLIGPEHDFDGIAQEQDVAAYDMSGDEILTILRGFGSD